MIWQGVPLGFDRGGKPIDYNSSHDGSGNAPTLVFGPPGSRKTVSLIATQLLPEPGKRSFVVIDPKGEICAITSKYRRRVSEVKIINPYGLLAKERPDMKSDGWNPLGDLDPDAASFGDEVQAKGDALIKTSSNERQPHFPDAARSGATGTIHWEVKDALAQNPPVPPSNVRRILTQEPEKLRAFVRKMVDSGDYDVETRVSKFLADNTEIRNIKSTIEMQTAWMTKPMRDDMYTATGVHFPDCAKRATTVYVIIPATELQSKATYLRLVLSSALRALYCHDGVPTTVDRRGRLCAWLLCRDQARPVDPARFLLAHDRGFPVVAANQKAVPGQVGPVHGRGRSRVPAGGSRNRKVAGRESGQGSAAAWPER
jgi:type IV secretory pathway TraG/TraD family ATPase VirD4